MIVLLGSLADEPLAAVVLGLTGRGRDVVLVDPDDPAGVGLSWSPGSDPLDGHLRCGERTADLREVSSAYVRSTGPLDPPWLLERHTAWCALLDTWPTRVVNRPCASATNTSKAYQSQVIDRCGLRVPRTLVTTSADAAREFFELCQWRVVYKSVSHQRSIVQRLGRDDLDRLDSLKACPTQFQEFVPGLDVRVHVIGERIFATEVDTPATDYRYAGRVGAERWLRETQLPAGIAAGCTELAQALGLELAGIDLRRTPDGGWFCFEANPSPAFTWYEQQSGQPLTDAVCDLLEQPSAPVTATTGTARTRGEDVVLSQS